MSIENQAIPLLRHEGDGFIVDSTAFNGILQQSDLLDRKVVVISIVGEYRRGKSFFLNFIMRYLANQDNPNWMHADASTVKGFSWRRGITRETDGIVMWSRAFPLGKEYAVVLLDTEGTYDEQSTNKTMSHVFACSALISSVQIFNVQEKITKRTMHEIQSFAEFGRLASCSEGQRAFQNLVFLVRDWLFDSDFEFGMYGGRDYLKHWLQKDKDGVKTSLETCFRHVSCNLLPYPGDKVKYDQNFTGNISEMSYEFCTHLAKVIEYLFSPEYLQCKKIGGKELKLKDFMTYFTMFAKSLNESGVEPKNLFQSQVENCNIQAKDAALQSYTTSMDDLTHGDEPLDDLAGIHEAVVTEAVRVFDETPKFGGNEHAKFYRNILYQELEVLLSKYEIDDTNKNVLQSGIAKKDQEILEAENKRIMQELEHKHALDTLKFERYMLEVEMESEQRRHLEEFKLQIHQVEQQAANERMKLKLKFQQNIDELQQDDEFTQEEIETLRREHAKQLRKIEQRAQSLARDMRNEAKSSCTIS